MITENDKDLLAALNGLSAERRLDKIREGVKELYLLEDEAAMFRKMLKKIFDLFAEYTGKETNDKEVEEFMQYFANVERIKEEA